uniref:Sulfhydryl oxidase n=1 Tax=Spongospora subterranea TaxID=70186 RepID=A0A0H5RAR6_9EUKA|eukprot:CRZ10742.1 hypothetical protein [Spongospora subterranea]
MTANLPEPEPCRVCDDMKEFLHKRGFRLPGANPAADQVDRGHSPTPQVESRADCPLDRAALGRSSWGLLHTMAAYYPAKPSKREQESMTEFMHRFAQFYPCATCRQHLIADLSNRPPTTGSRHLLSQWMCQLHNRVNKRLNKPLFDCAKVDERWRTGPSDGSCR